MNEPNYSKFVTRKWNIVSDQSNANYVLGNEVTYNTEVLKSNLCGYNDAYTSLLQHKYHSKIVLHLLNVWQNLMGQQ